VLTIIREDVDAAVATGVTAEDVAALADDGYRYDLIGGQLIRVSPAGFRHGRLAAELARRLGNFLVEHPSLGVVVGAETGFVLARDPDSVLGPDAAFVRRDRLPAEAERDGYLELAPDLAVEVVSPHDRWSYVTDKVETYLAAGVALVWVLDPRRRAVRVYRADGSEQRLRAASGDSLDGEQILPEFRLPLAELFAA